ncbi:MAG: RluA family pseudouridine synthase [Pseudomonadota bacterium]
MTDRLPTEFDDRWLLYEDPELLVLNKPSGLSLLADRDSAINLWSLAEQRFGPLKLVHRLDKGTSGVLLIARASALQRRLTRAFNQRLPRKTYLATVTGHLELSGSGRIDLPLRRGRKSRYRVAGPRETIQRRGNEWRCTADGGPAYDAETRLRLAAHGRSSTAASADAARSYLVLQPKTGRTHQLRVHLSWIGYPIRGDRLYGSTQQRLSAVGERLELHARSLLIPGLGTFRAPLPDFWQPASG